MKGRSTYKHSSRLFLLILVGALALIGALILQSPPEDDPATITDKQLLEMRPLVRQTPPHSRADDCRECHRHNHDTWHASYHRTMTQLVTPATAVADFGNRRINMPGVNETFLLHRRKGQPWVTFDLEITAFPINKLKRREFPLLLSTGSHHLQYFWAPSGGKRTMAQLPVVYLFEAKRWIPVNASFINPPDTSAHGTGSTWNESCVKCHATFPVIAPTGGFLEYDTTVAEFGIACESCHGPGQAHIQLHRDSSTDESRMVDPIVNPARLPPKLSAQVCGGCHSVYDQNSWQPHRPGEPFAQNRRTRTRASMLESINNARDHTSPAETEKATLELDNWFWPDGMSRVTGREYNNLTESACHTKGGMTCLHCHQMHQQKDDPRPVSEWANDQLRHQTSGDQSCLACHESTEYATIEHTHHTRESSGSRCNNCHMPHTSYGLLQAIRTHTITSPNAHVSKSTGRPTACNLCHLDRTLGWTADQLEKWYKQSKPTLDSPDNETSQVVRTLLEGDAAQRALTVWALSWEPATEAAGRTWSAPYAALLLKDPYPAVRFMAARSLRSLPGFAGFEYDFLQAADKLEIASEAALALWSTDTNRPTNAIPSLLLGPGGQLDQQRLNQHYARRNDREIVIAE